MSYTIELNNLIKSASHVHNEIKPTSRVVEVFSAMSKGQDLSHFNKTVADSSVKYIQETAARAAMGDIIALSELNEIRKFVIQPELLKEIQLISVFGTYKALKYYESPEVEITEYVPRGVKEQALGEDVGFGTMRKKKETVATTSFSGGHAVDYRKMQFGDMSDENALQEEIRKQIRNKFAKHIVDTVYNAVINASGVTYTFEGAGLTKTGVDEVLNKVRRFGKPTIAGSYALLSQFNGFAGYAGTTPVINGISEAVMNQIQQTGLIGMYNGAVLQEIPNPYDLTSVVTGKDEKLNFATMLPDGLGFVIPTGTASPVYNITRGGLTSFTGNDVTTGEVITRYDLEGGTLVAPGQEYKLALIHDTNLDDLAGK